MKTAVLIPCYNEEKTITKVISDFQKELPSADIYVYDNNSSDNTSEIAKNNVAIVKHEYRQGKGNVIRSMFRDIEADIYVMVDGDDTYPAKSVHDLIKPIINGTADMVTGDRLSGESYKKAKKRRFHALGNKIVTFFINKLFKSSIKDVMSGYRVFNRLFVKTIMVLSKGFEIETEMVLHALDKRFLTKEIPIEYKDRIEGSFSKLNTFKDGFKVMRTILWVFKDYKPLVFFGFWSFVFFIVSSYFGVIRFMNIESQLDLSNGIIIALSLFFLFFSIILFSIGLILDTVAKFHRLDYEQNINNYILNNSLTKKKD